MILCLRSDGPRCMIVLIDKEIIATEEWNAARELSQLLLRKVTNILHGHNLSLHSLTGIVVYEGPGSYTSLRIGISFVNALGYSLNIPVVQSSGENWIANGMHSMDTELSFSPVSAEYGGNARITKPKK